MAYNMYKQISKIRESLQEKGFVAKIPREIFGRELMLMFGMKKQTALKWIQTFSDVNLIKENENNTIDFI